ncbi:uncharacterized protein DUF1353 [Kribbella orskensis]|uniref:Uncharacterized protein DUF1353 n=1 Tax=Kribbella orskensis TaxID=2512216 RepID=A0ABY2BS97_9ACTN|nr:MULTISPECIES: DUF1353 domain-containing protein [Kribbella]TCN42857.1 uncharacterized protein DUF1353 [Kribbella sp. VKM Ac-2500]TCO29787.1 uncharacterized protein DUF1353 [Kribbella orskensis]
MMGRIKNPEPGRFFDDGEVDGPAEPGYPSEMQVCLKRVEEEKKPRYPKLASLVPSWLKAPPTQELFILERRIGYKSRDYGDHVVPADNTFRSDLTSVPNLFTWLVPRTGSHLPAALLHDGLVHDPNQPVSYIGPKVTRAQADLIFRDAMADLGTGWARRWLMWSAVSVATVWSGLDTPTVEAAAQEEQPREVNLANWYYRVVVFGSMLAIALLGAVATLDLLDIWNVLPWMGERAVGWELLYGAAFAVLIPAVLAILWARLRVAGLFVGISLSLLLHVTVALIFLSGLFQALEWAARCHSRWRRWRNRSSVDSADPSLAAPPV